MRGTDPTKSKWECPTMFYVCFRRNSPSDVSLNKIIRDANYLFVCNSRQHSYKLAIFYLIYVQMYKPKYRNFLYLIILAFLYLDAVNSVQIYRILMRSNFFLQVGFKLLRNQSQLRCYENFSNILLIIICLTEDIIGYV